MATTLQANPGVGDDLSAMSWVTNELQRSLDAAHKGLRRYLKEALAVGMSDVDTADAAILRSARVQLHQGVGALELVGLSIPAKVLRASESAVQRMINKPAIIDTRAVETIESASFAIIDYMQRLLARRPMPGVALFPQYRAVQQLAGGDRIHPADLWGASWHWHELPAEPGLTPRAADDEARDAMERLVLALLRRPDAQAKARLSDFCAELGAGARSTLAATTWRLAAAFFDAQASGLLDSDLYAKRMASRLLAQLRANVRSDDEVSERLASDLLFFCARANAPQTGRAPRLNAVRQAWALGESARSTDYETPRLGRFDPSLIVQARKRVTAAKDVWSAVAGGETRRLGAMAEPFALLGDSLQRLFPDGEVLAHALQSATARTTASGQPPGDALAMEMATAVLWLDAVLEDGELDAPGLAQRLHRVAARVDEAAAGGVQQPLESWIEELYRRVSDHQTMGSVVHELRASLTEVEKQIDQYFRDPRQREVLVPVPTQLAAMRGVLSVLDLEQASRAVVHMHNTVDELAATEVDPEHLPQSGVFERLADNLGALGFLIDMLSVQPQLAKSLFHFDAEQGRLQAVMAMPERHPAFAALDEAAAPAAAQLVEQAHALAAAHSELSDADLVRQLEALSERAVVDDQAGLARVATQAHQALDKATDDDSRQAVRAELAQAMNELAQPHGAPEVAAPLAPVRVTSEPVAPGDTGLEDDDEMRGIFIEEAQEVIGTARQSLQHLAANAENLGDITVVRRAFHTLKGSSRMVGLRDFGEAAWACEQLYNARLAEDARIDPPLQDFSAQALNYLADWIAAIEARAMRGHVSATIVQAAEALRAGAPAPVIRLPVPWPVSLLIDLPVNFPLDLPAALPAVERMAAAVAASAPQESEDWLDLGTTLAVAETAAASEDDGFDFELIEPTTALAPAEQQLSARVPDLPSAADLELPAWTEDELNLSLAAGASSEVDVPLSPADGDLSEFSLDLDAMADEVRIDDASAPEAGDDTSLDTHAPLQVAEAVELDFDAFESFRAGDAGSASPTPESTSEPPLDPPTLELPTLDELAQDHDQPALVLDVLPTSSGASGDEAVVDHDAPIAAPLHFLAAEAFAGSAEPDDTGSAEDEADEEPMKVIGPLRIGIPLFNIFLNEADEQSRRLVTELAEWAIEHETRPVSETAVALAHSLAGNSATVGYSDLSALARALEHALLRSQSVGSGRAGEPELFNDAADEIRRLLHQFAAGFLKPVLPALMERLVDHQRWPLVAAPAGAGEGAAEGTGEGEGASVAMAQPAIEDELDIERDIDAVDAFDPELLPIFEEEADELLPQLQQHMARWMRSPADRSAADGCMRCLHTFKGGARLAGAMRLGEQAHRIESTIEGLLAAEQVSVHELELLQMRLDHMAAGLKAIRKPAAPVSAAQPAAAQPEAPSEPPTTAPDIEHAEVLRAVDTPEVTPAVTEEAAAPGPPPPLAPLPSIDWGRFSLGSEAIAPPAAVTPGATGVVRVRAGLLDRMVNGAGEVSIARARIESDVRQLQGSLGDLTDSLGRMRRELRDIEVQAETQISSRIEAAKASAQAFDPLEMDRFTRLQELTRMMAESVNDVATVQRGLQRTLQSTEDQLAAQARLTRELQDDLLRTRMIDFESLADRLYRVVRQAAKDTGKQVRLDLVGGAIEVDRGVLERMVGPFEHLLRNSVVHGIESTEMRLGAGKSAVGAIAIKVTQSGNEVSVEFSDDGGGLDLARIRERAVERGLLDGNQAASDDELAQLIFLPGFTTASSVTELAGRGIGMDVVRAEVNAMGGRIETVSRAGQGMSLRLVLPLTTAVTQVVMLRCGKTRVAVPSTLVEVVRRVPTVEVRRAHVEGMLAQGDTAIPFYWLATLVEGEAVGEFGGRTQFVVVVRSAQQRVALHVDEVIGNQEVVVKNLGPQLSRMPGLAGVTLLPNGAVALIYNPVALVTLYGEALRQARAPAAQGMATVKTPASAPLVQRPLVMVVDDSLTVRRVTQRLLEREGYRVTLAKDGVDALERLVAERPVVMLCDIEMPRMDGFELVRLLRDDPERAGIPIIMITSRIAQRHRDHAAQLGVEHYLGKPFSEEALLALVTQYTLAQVPH